MGKNRSTDRNGNSRNIMDLRLESELDSEGNIVPMKKNGGYKYVSYECEHILFFSSFQLSISLMFSLYCKIYHLAALNTGLFLTSILHWRKPEMGTRRSIDMFMAFLNLLAHALFSLNTNSLCAFVCTCAVILVATFYFVGKKYSYNSYSTIYHLLIHTVGNASALAMYYIYRKKEIDYA
ncbi:conserved Plasmodium protein, unknown function [Plasmodium ovale]|uniref:Uncharacterized protein n=1 Tax=Plasmodium ovale TaxID=36330 RepID=A0A1C3KME9_PLAOA|nr:conserved Plasmodium protein, unknown function [Plasmodium ovale]